MIPLSAPSPNSIGPGRPCPGAVLDTQVVLDWLVFRNPAAAVLGAAIAAGQLRWVASAAMRAELVHVLDRGLGGVWRPDCQAVAASFDRLSCTAQAGSVPLPGLRCTDPDDQMFIDLALASSARWLFSRDRALLKLAPRARRRGVIVTRPADWLGDTQAAA